ncbi:hypothetical protein H0H92_000183 [Tricholoma furcatifolium]|nr:hypothetical protein H0H92_000183 [Tricholoma furcatifolium]
MSSTYPADSPSRAWWSMSPKQQPQSLQHQFSGEKSARSSGLNSIAVALGLKSKKHTLLTIQDPVHSSRPSVPAIVTKTGNRPPSKSVSSMRSRVDSIGPHTPKELPVDNRHSLLTISDTDPFAVHTISSPTHTPYDPKRLSAHSNSSNPDYVTKNTEPVLNRSSSYASTSSQSNAHGGELSPLSPTIDSSKRLRTKKSVASLHRKQSLMSGDQSLGSAWESLTSANKSIMQAAPLSTTLAPDENRFSQPETNALACPPMRARGMTESSAFQRPSFLPGEGIIPTSSSSSSLRMSSVPSPRVIIRQPSVSRIGLPPSAPPRQELPPPPPVADRRLREDLDAVMPVSTSSASSSSLSFASSIPDPLINQSYNPHSKKGSVVLERSTSTGAGSALNTSFKGLSPTAPHSLKKAVSHQSLGRRSSPSISAAPVPLPELPALPSRGPRKQRSFHQPKFPLPPLSPLRPSNASSTPASLPQADSQTPSEQKRSSAGGLSMPGRKRLFSGSRRPSTSQSAVAEDDNQSVFSVRSVPEQIMSASIFKSMSQPLSPAPNSSFWDEGSILESPSSPRLAAHDYTPQPIMTPAEMAKLEASADELRNSHLQRGLSILSTSTVVSTTSDGGLETLSQDGPLTETTSLDAVANRLMARSTSLMQKGLSAPPRLAIRPSTSQASMKSPAMSERSSPISRSPSPSLASLPPPPRRSRPRATVVQDDPALPSLPPPPGRKYVRPKMSVEKVLHRRSIMRKPSFLEISDDEGYQDTDAESVELPSGSFLDLARESFDTTRSIAE